MPFGIIGRTGPGMRQVVRFRDRSTGRGTFGGEFKARHCNQWGLTFAATRSSICSSCYSMATDVGVGGWKDDFYWLAQGEHLAAKFCADPVFIDGSHWNEFNQTIHDRKKKTIKRIVGFEPARLQIFTRTWLRYVRVFAITIPSVVCRRSVCRSYSGVEAFGNRPPISSAVPDIFQGV